MSSFEPAHKHKKPSPPGHKPVPGPRSFKGIYNFGKNGSALANHPYLAGTYLGFYWSELEPAQGQFNWKTVDDAMQPWTSNGKNIILRVSTSGWTGWRPPFSEKGTPQWVYDMGVSSVTETDKAVKPQYWNPHFLSVLDGFVQALAARYDGNAHITAIEIGVGDGGETKPDTHSSPQRLQMWQKIGYTDALWWDTIQKIVGIYQGAFKHLPLALMPNNSFLGKTAGYDEHKVVNWAIAQQPPLWLQNNGVIAGKKLDPMWLKTTIIAEQRQQTAQSGDTLAEDLQLMLNSGASYALCFEADLASSRNQATLQQYASLVQH
jgi:Beta-galactosidase